MIVINKAEGDNMNQARLAQKAFQTALHYYPPKPSGWLPKVLLASALNHQGIDQIADNINQFVQLTKKNGFFEKNRLKQNEYWLYETVNQVIKDNFYKKPEVNQKLKKLLEKLEKREMTAFEAAEILLSS